MFWVLNEEASKTSSTYSDLCEMTYLAYAARLPQALAEGRPQDGAVEWGESGQEPSGWGEPSWAFPSQPVSLGERLASLCVEQGSWRLPHGGVGREELLQQSALLLRQRRVLGTRERVRWGCGHGAGAVRVQGADSLQEWQLGCLSASMSCWAPSDGEPGPRSVSLWELICPKSLSLNVDV